MEQHRLEATRSLKDRAVSRISALDRTELDTGWKIDRSKLTEHQESDGGSKEDDAGEGPAI